MKKSDKQERPEYILCPRCETNYIDKREKHCAVCKAELGLADPSVLLPEDDDVIERICPVCKINLLAEDEDICFECKKEIETKAKEAAEVIEDDDDLVEEWVEPFVDEEEEIPAGMQEIFLDEDEEEEEEEDIEPVNDEPDDFDFNVDPDDYEDDEEEDEEL